MYERMIGLVGRLIGSIIGWRDQCDGNHYYDRCYILGAFILQTTTLDMHPAVFRNLSSAMRPWDEKP